MRKILAFPLALLLEPSLSYAVTPAESGITLSKLECPSTISLETLKKLVEARALTDGDYMIAMYDFEPYDKHRLLHYFEYLAELKFKGKQHPPLTHDKSFGDGGDVQVDRFKILCRYDIPVNLNYKSFYKDGPLKRIQIFVQKGNGY